jgi:alkylhydroperoxidase/carboxymuconolactone decarboxylase family protein YurZ
MDGAVAAEELTAQEILVVTDVYGTTATNFAMTNCAEAMLFVFCKDCYVN